MNLDVREMRMNKVAADTMDFMNDLSRKVLDEKELIDVLGVWSQVLGARLASLEGATEEGMDKFLPFLENHMRIAYTARWGQNDE